MKQVTTLSQEVFNQKAAELTSDRYIRKEIALSEFNVIDNEHIEVDGVKIKMDARAYKQLLFRLRIPKAFANRFKDQFGDNGLAQLVDMMKASRADSTVTFLVDPKERTIADVLPGGYAVISNESFLDFTTRYIDQYNLGVTHIGQDGKGGVSINCVSPSGIVAVPGMSDEVFQTGVQFRNTPHRGLEVSPYLNRLVCTNGMTSTAFSENYGLMNLNEKKINEFNEHMVNMASNGFQPMGMVEQIRKANSTDASLAEMQSAMSSLLSADKNIDYDYLQRYVPIERAKRAYDQLGANSAEFTKKQLAMAKSGMSVWDLVNGMTNFASNESRFKINDGNRANVMMRAGNLLMKSAYDTEGYLNVDPFATRSLLTEDETARLRGEA